MQQKDQSDKLDPELNKAIIEVVHNDVMEAQQIRSDVWWAGRTVSKTVFNVKERGDTALHRYEPGQAGWVISGWGRKIEVGTVVGHFGNNRIF